MACVQRIASPSHSSLAPSVLAYRALSPPAYDSPYTCSASDATPPLYTTALPLSPLGPIHHARPEDMSSFVQAICRLCPGSFLAKLIQRSKDTAANREKAMQEKLDAMTTEQRMEHERQVAEILEVDRVMAANIKMLGL